MMLLWMLTLVRTGIRVLDELVEEWDQRAIVMKVIVIDFIILIAFLMPMVIFFDPADLTLQWVGMTFTGFVFAVPIYFWKRKVKWYTLSVRDFLSLASERESTEAINTSSRLRIAFSFVLVFILAILIIMAPLYIMLFIEEYPEDQFSIMILATVLFWAIQGSIGFGLGYESDTDRNLYFEPEVHNATRVVKMIEKRYQVDDLLVGVMIVSDSRSVTVFFSCIRFVLAETSDVAARLDLESYPGEGTSVSLEVKGSFGLQEKDDEQEIDVGLGHNVGLWIETKRKGFTIWITYPKDEGEQKVDDLGDDGYCRILDLLFQTISRRTSLVL
jgi:hypothetical protein